MQNILIVMAMLAEATPIITELNLVENTLFQNSPPFRCYSGNRQAVSINLVWLGHCPTYNIDNVGTVPASIATYLAIQMLNPDIVISAGTAGGFLSKGLRIADVVLSTRIFNHDRRIQFPLFHEYGEGGYDSFDMTGCNRLGEIDVKHGVVSTGNSLDHSDEDDIQLRQNNALVKEMECAAVAWVCMTLKKPIIGLKVVTDLVDGGRPTTEEFLENLSHASQVLKSALLSLIDYLSNLQN